MRVDGPPRRAARILARTLYRDLVADGFDDRQVIALAAELIGAVTAHLGGDRKAERDVDGRA